MTRRLPLSFLSIPLLLSGLALTLGSCERDSGAPKETAGPTHSSDGRTASKAADGSRPETASGEGNTALNGVPAAGKTSDPATSASSASSPTRSATGSRADSMIAKSEPQSPGIPLLRAGDAIAKASEQQLPDGVAYKIVQPGTGESPQPGATVRVHITCWLRDGARVGQEFFSSRSGSAPSLETYRLDSMDLVKGVLELLLDMKKGERRLALVPASLAYGEEGYGALVPRNSDLLVDVELVSFR